MKTVLVPLDVPVRIGREEAQRRAAEELAKAKYGGTPEWAVELGDRANALLERLVAFFLRFFGPAQPGGGGVSWGFLLAVVVLLVAVGLVLWRVGLPRWRGRRRDAEVELDPARAATDYRAMAEQAAAAGDWAAAVRDRFRALVRELEVQTILDVRPARTAWEAAYRASQALPGCADTLRGAAEGFNAVVYGDRPATEAGYRQLVAADDEVTAAAAGADLTAEEVAR